jgi:hypothetical protein
MKRGALITVAGLTASILLSACVQATQVPSTYAVAQSYLAKANNYEGDANKAMMSGDFNQVISDYQAESAVCAGISRHTNGPDSQLNQLLRSYSSDCMADMSAQVAFMNNPSLSAPTTLNDALISDINDLNQRWKALGY